VLRSDLLAALGPDELFDVVYWNSSFVEAPAGFESTHDLHHALFDPGYRLHERFLRDAPGHLREGGRLLLGFSSLGNHERLAQLAAGSGLRVRRLAAQTPAGGPPIEYQLLELCG
jgi:release factor glutamine methyltransferase